MYYNIVENMDDMEAMDYDWEEVDGKPRYRWYKYALNSVYMISSIDDVRDIENIEFDDLGAWYECVAWVADNDPEALEHIMGKLIKPVTDIVKQKLLGNLEALNYYSSCAIVKKHLRSQPAPAERTFQRKKVKFTESVSEDIAKQIFSMSEMLVNFKTTAKEKLYTDDLREPLSKLLNMESFAGKQIEQNLEALDWLLKNCQDDLKGVFDKPILIEIKENFLNYLASKELYKLCTLLEDCIPIKESDFYFEIPPYIKKFSDEDLPMAFDDDDYFPDNDE